MIIPFAAGGPTDIVGRLVTAKMREAGFEQPLIIDNRGGGGGSVGTEAAARSDPDGYTLMIGTNSTHGTNPHLYPNVGYHPVDSFVSIAQIGVTPMMLAIHPKVPARSVAEFIAYAKANPGKLNHGSAGVGSIGHILGGLLNKQAGTETVLVPYQGSGPASRDLIAGVTDFSIDGLPVLAPSARAGSLFLLATTLGKRAQAFPDVPTLAESGFPGHRRLDLERDLRADRNAEADRRSRLQVRRAGVGRRDPDRTAAGRGRRADAGHHAGEGRSLHQARIREMGTARQTLGRQGRIAWRSTNGLPMSRRRSTV